MYIYNKIILIPLVLPSPPFRTPTSIFLNSYRTEDRIVKKGTKDLQFAQMKGKGKKMI